MTGGFEVKLKSSIGSSVRLATAVAADCWLVKVDPGELELALVNVARMSRHRAATRADRSAMRSQAPLPLMERLSEEATYDRFPLT